MKVRVNSMDNAKINFMLGPDCDVITTDEDPGTFTPDSETALAATILRQGAIRNVAIQYVDGSVIAVSKL